MNPIATLLERYPVLVLDGAMATELERRGRDLRDPLELIALEPREQRHARQQLRDARALLLHSASHYRARR